MDFLQSSLQALPELRLHSARRISTSDDESGYSSPPTTPGVEENLDNLGLNFEEIWSPEETEFSDTELNQLVSEIVQNKIGQEGNENEIACVGYASEYQNGPSPLKLSSFNTTLTIPQTAALFQAPQQVNFGLSLSEWQGQHAVVAPNFQRDMAKIPTPTPSELVPYTCGPAMPTGNAVPIANPLCQHPLFPVWSLGPSIASPGRSISDLHKRSVPLQTKDQKYWKRRIRNNISARRSREAKRVKEQSTSERAERLEKENIQLKEMVCMLQERLKKVKSYN